MKKIITCVLLICSLATHLSAQTNTKALSKSEIMELCDEALSFMRNEIYARHGYVFSKQDVQDLFSMQSWYKPVSDNKLVVLSKVEQNNVALIKQVESEREAKLNAIKSYFSNLNNAFLKKDLNYIKNILKDAEEPYDEYMAEALGKTLKKIDVSNIHSHKAKKGTFKVSIDNGLWLETYSLYFENNEITLTYSGGSTSDVIDVSDDCFNTMEASEFGYSWIFKIDNKNNIILKRMYMAG